MKLVGGAALLASLFGTLPPVEVEFDARSCDALVEQASAAIEKSCTDRVQNAKRHLRSQATRDARDAKRRYEQEIAMLEAQIEDLRKGFLQDLARCTAGYLRAQNVAESFTDKTGSIRLYLDHTSVCGPHGLLRFSILPLLRKPDFELEKVRIISGETVIEAALDRQWLEGGVYAGAVFNLPSTKEGVLRVEFVGTSGEVIVADGVEFPVRG